MNRYGISGSLAKAHLTIDTGDWVYEFEGFLSDYDIERHADDYDYFDPFYRVRNASQPARFETDLKWSGEKLLVRQYQKEKSVPTDLPNMGEFYD